MLYQLPAGVTSIDKIDFSHAFRLRCRPLAASRMIPSGPSQPSVLGFKVKKWGNGANNSSTPKRYRPGAVYSKGKTAHA